MTSGVTTQVYSDLLGLTGQQVGRFSIQRVIGLGGVASVYQAFDGVRGHSVALKVLHPDPDEATYNRFRREALNAGILRHPNIVRIFQVGNTLRGGAAYIAMELVEGESLAQLLQQRTRLLPHETCAIVEPIARALAFAHAAEIVHRDVKPSNILLRNARAGCDHSIQLESIEYPVVPLLSDFGIARFLDQPDLTYTGRTVGTPAYMAPEQCQGERHVDGRADIYALGTVLYRCLTGQLPFHGSVTQILHAQVYEPVVVAAAVADELPNSLFEILRRTLAKAPSERYQSAEELAQDLHNVANEYPAPVINPGTETATMQMVWMPEQAAEQSDRAITLVPSTGQELPHNSSEKGSRSGHEGSRHSFPSVLVLVGALLMAAAGVGYLLGTQGTTANSKSIAAGTAQADLGFNATAMVPLTASGRSAAYTGTINVLPMTAGPVATASSPDVPIAPVVSSVLAKEPSPTATAIVHSLQVHSVPVLTVTNTREAALTTDNGDTAAGLEPLPTPDIGQASATPLQTEITSADLEAFAIVCNYVIEPFFVDKIDRIPEDVRADFDCPATDGFTSQASRLDFEHGHILRLDETAQIYVYYVVANSWERTELGGTNNEGQAPLPPDKPGLFVPTGDFGAVWNDLRRNSALGFARTERPTLFTAVVQVFPGGILVGNLDDDQLFVYLMSRFKW